MYKRQTWTCQKEERGTLPVVGRRRKHHRYNLVAKAKKSRSHVAGEGEINKEERDVLENMRKVAEYDMDKV